ncbi:hypothetical protein ACMA1D_05385 [Streptomyces sp. 796.1]|uniref:hypothetical protein n=1 Tax=Streptomyces sp. 796.1 TaxID=3163029 RepID=UPI0039C9F96E
MTPSADDQWLESCSACNARCDWLLINHRRNNQWLEPETTRADFDALIAVPDSTVYPSVEQDLVALGFEGVLAGAYLG